jgi:hypothetical protein
MVVVEMVVRGIQQMYLVYTTMCMVQVVVVEGVQVPGVQVVRMEVMVQINGEMVV